MNLILLVPEDFAAADRVCLTGRRAAHIREVHRAAEGDLLTVGLLGGRIGRATITALTADVVEMQVTLTDDPPAPLDLTLVLALPRPKVLNRVIAAVTSMGVKQIHLMNAWRVEKSYWKSPRLAEANLLAQRFAGLEQARDTILPEIHLHRFFRAFVEGELPSIGRGTLALVAHPHAASECPRDVRKPVTLVIGPEGGFIESELSSLRAAGFQPVTVGPRVLRVETAVAALIARLT